MKTIFTLWAAVFLAATALSQVPEKMSYQAVIRNSSGELVQNSQVGMKISILQGSSSGTPLYSETHTPTTNANGLVTLQIGNGNSTDDFSLIDWKGGPFFIQTETDPSGGTNYIITGTSQLLSVPFALYAKVAENVPGGMAETDPVFTAWDKSSGISIMESQVSDLKDYLTTETDPEFDNSVAAGITQADTAAWNAASVGAYIETDPVFGAHVVSSITGADISSWNNKLDTEVDGSVTNELQDLQISGNILSLSDDTSPVDLSVYLDNTDNQQLTIFGDSLGIENGNRVDLSTINYWQQTGSDIYYQAGKVGIGTINPSQRLEVADTIYSSMGGFKFPDGTVQSTAASGAGVASINDLSDGRTIGYSIFLGSGTGINDDGTNNFNAGLGIDALTSNTSGYSNTAMGYQPLYSNTTGHGNTAIGNYALYSNTGGYGNIATGYRALYSNTSGRHNTASGYGALASNTSGDLNTANGFQALGSNTTGQSNTASGYQALNTNTEGQDNTASGLYALFSNSTGKWNTANGSRALHSNNTGNSNVGLGYSANRFNRAGSQNTIIGYEAGRGPTIHDKSGNVFLGYQAGYFETGDSKLYIENSNDSLPLIWGDFGADSLRINGSLVVTGNIHGVGSGNVSSIDDLSDGRTTGYSVFLGMAAGMNDDGTDNFNVALGDNALHYNNTGYSNTASGFQALYSNTTGSNNTAHGNLALSSNTTASYNTANGSGALNNNTTGHSNTACGFQVLFSNTTGHLNTADGYRALFSNTTGIQNTSVGYQALYSNTTGISNTAMGYKALNDNSTGSRNTATGEWALYANTSGYHNTANGYQALYSNTTGYSNVALGVRALGKNTNRSNLVAVGDSALYNNGLNSTVSYHATKNTAIGSKALYSNTTGYHNTADGYMALFSNTTGIQNTASGFQALYSNTTGCYNTAIGLYALFSNSTGNNNTANGSRALRSNTTGNYNTAMGNNALYSNSTGSSNTSFGNQALNSNTTGNYNTAIGVNAGPNSTGLSNTGAFGYGATTYSNNTIQIGNADITQIGGYAAWSNLSDGRFKVHVKPNVPGLDFIMKLRPVTFNWDLQGLENFQGSNEVESPKSDKLEKEQSEKEKKVYTGFIAQEVEKAAADCGFDFSGIIRPTTPKSTYHLSYAEFVVPLVKALQEQQKQIEEQHKRIATLMQEIEQLKK